MAIKGFSGRYAFLSNFYIEPDGTHVEGEYQARKVTPPAVRIMKMEPKYAKKAGRSVQKRADWEKIRVNTMHALVWLKFVDHPNLKTALLATGVAELYEENDWGDRFWGTVNGEGQNYLGRILMAVRDKLREAT